MVVCVSGVDFVVEVVVPTVVVVVVLVLVSAD